MSAAVTKALKRVVKTVLSIEQSEGQGARVRRSIGTYNLRNLDPFLMLDEFKVGGRAGFPDHPHRGFETVTYMLDGTFEHEDFEGHRGKIGPGDLQWMTAGKGIVHAEMPLGSTVATGLQLWVNLPSSAKMMPPRYQELPKEQVPDAKSDDGKVTVKVIAGSSYGVEAKVHTVTPIYYLDISMQPNATFDQEIPAGYTAFAYTLAGNAAFGSQPSEPHCTLVFSKEGDHIQATTAEGSARFVIIAGEPIGERIVQHGPFVMNTELEIRQAIMDYQLGRNGFEKAPVWESEIGKRAW
ncbi:RNA pol II transcription cofactor [Polyrhizophydium stewartii]|uniref:RNA pol II transcription cofactor n=1 Tax=Polyrhizophydium stewartii TaxID=2732419 RepID=A0ABR4MWK8_9FUNG